MDFNTSSPGKLLITSEYYVVKGALALAIPTKFKQSLDFICTNSNKLEWKSYDRKNELKNVIISKDNLKRKRNDKRDDKLVD